MSKLIEHSAFLEQDPLDINSVYMVLKVGMTKNAVEAGCVELAALAKGWNETGSPCEYLRGWLVQESVNSLVAEVTRMNKAAKLEEAAALTETILSSILPPT